MDDNKDKTSFLDKMQAAFDTCLEIAFKHTKITIGIGVGFVILAVVLFKNIDQRLFPELERNQFAVEVYLNQGSSLEATSKVITSLENTLKRDKRVSTVTSL